MKAKISITTIVLFFVLHNSYGQKRKHINYDNLFMGFEIGKSKSYDRYMNFAVWAQIEHDYFKLAVSDSRNNRSEEQKLLKGEDDDSPITTPGLADIGLMYGKTYRLLRRHQFQFGAGISIVSKTIPDDEFNRTKQPYYLERFKESATVGLPAELRYSFVFNRGVGVGLTWKGNANSLNSYGNFSVGASIGLF